MKRVITEFINIYISINAKIINLCDILSCKTCNYTSWFVSHIGKEHNFNLYDETVSSFLGVPYDYGSVMHYSKTSFNKDQDPTIVTKIPEFLDVIGQRMEFSDSDLLKLNRLYNCSKFMITLYVGDQLTLTGWIILH